MADIAESLLLNALDSVARTVYTTASISPTANSLVLAFVTSTDDGFSEDITYSSIIGTIWILNI